MKTKITTTAFIIMSKRPGSSLQSQQQSKKTQKSLGSFFTSAKSVLLDDDKTTTGYKIFCDLDGVLVDFEAGVKKIFNGQGPGKNNMISSYTHFMYNFVHMICYSLLFFII